MDSERIFKIVIMDLTSDKFKLEEELESVINSNYDDNKINRIKSILSKIVECENSITKFSSMFSNNDNNNNNLTKEENGKK